MKRFEASYIFFILVSLCALMVAACGGSSGGGGSSGSGGSGNVTPPAAGSAINLAETGQTICYNATGAVIACAGTGQDGELTKGVAWPVPRFTDNTDGTVTDNLTGLMWLKDANCFGTRTWTQALTDANALTNGQCNLSDGSMAGDWRLPNRKELMSLIDRSKYNPALPAGHLFTNVQAYYYWSSTTTANDTGYAWGVDMWYGYVTYDDKASNDYVWPVRSGQ